MGHRRRLRVAGAAVGAGQGGPLCGASIAESDLFYERELDAAVEKILARRDELKVVIIAGPSSSGKTTTTIKVREKLAAAGITTVPLAVDNYFFDLEVHPKIGDDDRDFETPQALDLALIDRHLDSLVNGRSIVVPRYDFTTGKRSGDSGTCALGEDQVLLIDSLHGLFPEMTRSVAEERKFRLYMETLSQMKGADGRFLRWADIRMLRRVVRDMLFRNYSPRDTIRHWHLVRRSELRYIVPELRRAHAVVNSFLPYELPIMKSRVEEYLPALIEQFAANPEMQDALERTLRVRGRLRAAASGAESVFPTARSCGSSSAEADTPTIRDCAEECMNVVALHNEFEPASVVDPRRSSLSGAAATSLTRRTTPSGDPERARTRKWVAACALFSVAVVLALLAIFIPGPRKILDIRLAWAAGAAAVVVVLRPALPKVPRHPRAHSPGCRRDVLRLVSSKHPRVHG